MLQGFTRVPQASKTRCWLSIHRVQNGLEPEDWKSFKTIGSGVREIRISDDGNTFRVMYVAKFANRVYVLHSFQKKTQKTRQQDIDIAKTRYKAIIKSGSHE